MFAAKGQSQIELRIVVCMNNLKKDAWKDDHQRLRLSLFVTDRYIMYRHGIHHADISQIPNSKSRAKLKPKSSSHDTISNRT